MAEPLAMRTEQSMTLGGAEWTPEFQLAKDMLGRWRGPESAGDRGQETSHFCSEGSWADTHSI